MGRIFKLACATLAPAVIAAGIAVAAQDGDGDRGSGTRERPRMIRHEVHPGPPFMRGLTYGELHVRQNGDDVVIRLDRGKVESVSDESITIKENNGSSVTIPVDDDTKVLTPRRRNAGVDDLNQGQAVMVHRKQGEAAEVIAVVPRRGQFHRGPRGARPVMLPPGPPPGM